jgi:hypothetical protein
LAGEQAFQLTDAIVPGVSDAFGETSASPGREPLVGVFWIDDEEIRDKAHRGGNRSERRVSRNHGAENDGDDLITIIGNHFNASFPSALEMDPTTPIRCSDHDPMELRLNDDD